MSLKKNTTDFGFKEIPVHEKNQRVAQVFYSVAQKYDLMNDLMSFGLHRYWKNFTVMQSRIRPGQTILDIACGTGDLAIKMIKKMKNQGQIYLVDINQAMLQQCRNRMLNLGLVKNILPVQANAEQLPFPANFFDCITIGFGLRNVTDKSAALRSLYRVLKPGGHLLVLEFSKPLLPLLAKLYDTYSFQVLPKLGDWICRDANSYQYLVESIRMHPDQQALKHMMMDCGFEDVIFYNLTGGIVALHKGLKY